MASTSTLNPSDIDTDTVSEQPLEDTDQTTTDIVGVDSFQLTRANLLTTDFFFTKKAGNKFAVTGSLVHRSLIGRAIEGTTPVDPVLLEEALVAFETAIAEIRRANRAKVLAGGCAWVKDQPWFAEYAKAKQKAASSIQAPASNASYVELDRIKGLLDMACNWHSDRAAARKQGFDAFVQELGERRDNAMTNELFVAEFVYTNPVEHAVIEHGLGDDLSREARNSLDAALRVFETFERRLSGDHESQLRKMGFSPAPSDRSNRSHKRGTRPSGNAGSRHGSKSRSASRVPA